MPKQYQVIAGQTVLQHSLMAFKALATLQKIMVVVAPGDRHVAELGVISESCCVVDVGGNSRAATVLNGLKALSRDGATADDWVLVHDAARCLVRPDQIESLMAACRDDAVGGLLAVPLADTLKASMNGRVHETLERSEKWLAQTPQMFRLGQLMVALEIAGDRATDEASAMEMQGLKPKLVMGDPLNFKVTYAQDFELAELILLSRQYSVGPAGVKPSW